MSERPHASARPRPGWRPVQGTLALALCVVALAIALAFPPEGRTHAVPSLSFSAAVAALALATWASWPPGARLSWTWPWRKAHPLRSTVASALVWGAVAVASLMFFRTSVGGSRGGLGLALPTSTTLLFLSKIASTDSGRFDRIVWGFFTASWWWFWFHSATR